MRTRRGLGWLNMGRWTIISWYANSSRSVSCKVPEHRLNVRPRVAAKNWQLRGGVRLRVAVGTYLDDAVEDEDRAISFGVEHKDILELAAVLKENVGFAIGSGRDFKRHALAGPEHLTAGRRDSREFPRRSYLFFSLFLVGQKLHCPARFEEKFPRGSALKRLQHSVAFKPTSDSENHMPLIFGL